MPRQGEVQGLCEGRNQDIGACAGGRQRDLRGEGQTLRSGGEVGVFSHCQGCFNSKE